MLIYILLTLEILIMSYELMKVYEIIFFFFFRFPFTLVALTHI